MTASDLIDASFRFILALAPFALVYSVVSMADQLVGLLKRVASPLRSKSREW